MITMRAFFFLSAEESRHGTCKCCRCRGAAAVAGHGHAARDGAADGQWSVSFSVRTCHIIRACLPYFIT